MLGKAGVVAVALLAGRALASEWQFIEADTFKKRLAANEHMLVAFVAPEDELSKPLLPEWRTLREQSSSTAALNCTSIPKVCREADVSSFPTIRLYQANGDMVRYRGPRKASSYVYGNSALRWFADLCLTNVDDRIAQFLERMDRPVVTDLISQAQPAFSTVDDIVVIAQLRSEDNSFLGHFHEVAGEFRDRYTFAVDNLPRESTTSRVLCRNNLDDIEHLSGDLDRVGALEELIEKCVTPLILPLTRRNEWIFNKIAKSPVYYFSDDEADRTTYVNMMRPIAKLFSEYLAFATVDSNEYPHMPQTFGLANKRGLCLQNLHNGQVFHFKEKEMSANAVQQFIIAVSEGKEEPWNHEALKDNKHDEL